MQVANWQDNSRPGKATGCGLEAWVAVYGTPWPYLFTEEQYRAILTTPADAPGTDLLECKNGFVGICKELFLTREIYDAREGSAALRRYVFRMRPKVLFHGYLHQEGEYQMGWTLVGVFEVITMR